MITLLRIAGPRTRLVHTIAAAAAWGVLACSAHAQVVFGEVEPNSDKSEATLAVCLAPGDALTGTTTGIAVALGDSNSTSVDTFRLRTCALPVGVYRHELALTSPISGHSVTLRGLVQSGAVGVGGTATAIDATLSTAVGTGSAPRVVAWYGFGASEELYWRVGGLASTVQPYTATLTTSSVAPVFVGTFAPGQITITTIGQGLATDTDLWLYDASFTAIPAAGNDDAYPANVVESELTRSLAPGTYYLAISGFNFANDRVAAADDAFVQGNLTDSPDVATSNSTVANLDVSFAISDTGHTVATAATVNVGRVQEIGWYRFDVLAPLFESFCPGDGTQALPCPCANDGASGRGCANSANAQGALLVASGATNPDTVVLTCSGMPSLAYSIFLKGDASSTGAVFGDGVRCVDGGLIRLRVKLSSAGVASFPEAGDPLLSVRGATPPGSGATGFYQTYYRNASALFCPPATFNVSNGWQIVW